MDAVGPRSGSGAPGPHTPSLRVRAAGVECAGVLGGRPGGGSAAWRPQALGPVLGAWKFLVVSAA